MSVAGVEEENTAIISKGEYFSNIVTEFYEKVIRSSYVLSCT